jgi:hypothetical protein
MSSQPWVVRASFDSRSRRQHLPHLGRLILAEDDMRVPHSQVLLILAHILIPKEVPTIR